MFDAHGTLTFDEPPTVIAPSLTRDQFLASSLANGATAHVENELYHSWKLGGTFRSAGVELLVVLFFQGQQLTMMELMDPDPRFGSSWAEVTLDKEMARKASHDAWLSRALPPHRDSSWGSVWSGYDAKGGFALISVRYGAGK